MTTRQAQWSALTKAQDVARIAFRLSATYPATDLGNPSEPLDDLIYLVLSGQTSAPNFQSAFGRLKAAFPGWRGVSAAPAKRIAKYIACGGLARQKAAYLKRILSQIEHDFGAASLRAIADYSDGAMEAYLTSLPGVGVKTARCVMMYAFDRDVFPVDIHCLRILSRLGVIEWSGERAETRAIEAQQRVPVPLRRSLHIDLIQHGRTVCTSVRPRCDDCVVKDLCVRSKARAAPAPRLTTVDLCCGAGGFSWGFMQAGFDVALGVDLCQSALDTFAANIPHASTLKLDITDEAAITEIKSALGRVAPTVVIAGTPCQGFSRAGPRDPDDKRNSILRCAMQVAVRLRPKVIVFENVSNVRTTMFAHHLRSAEGILRRAGYCFGHAVLDAQAFGVPQTRRRLILVGVRKGCPDKLRAALLQLASRPRIESATVAAALTGLNPCTEDAKRGHDPMDHSEKVRRKIVAIRPGTGPLSYRKLAPDQPAATLICGHRAMPCHYATPRTITVREAARIQGFPDDFWFFGPRGSRMQQVANAVPPKLAIGVARTVQKLLQDVGDHPADRVAQAVLNRVGIRPEPPASTPAVATPSEQAA